MSVTVYAGSVCELVMFSNCGRTSPVDEVALDVFPRRMRTDFALGRMAPSIDLLKTLRSLWHMRFSATRVVHNYIADHARFRKHSSTRHLLATCRIFSKA